MGTCFDHYFLTGNYPSSQVTLVKVMEMDLGLFISKSTESYYRRVTGNVAHPLLTIGTKIGKTSRLNYFFKTTVLVFIFEDLFH